MQTVKMYSTGWCPYCARAKELLRARGVTAIEEIDIDGNPGARQTMMQETGRRSVPQIFIGGTHVGGSDELAALDKRGGLVPLLQGA